MKILILFISLVAFGFSAEKEFDCSKRYCKEMKSCKEAMYYLNNCGMDKFDRDGDGVPCENVCGKKKKRK
ncbi:excalibur calcium-binding domain-containing protein [Campylobacter suis]|uniref:Excalibur calcium-binding domain-containing protein n=1 Tax=Campylobacter suis TaxID=2790657 RepID=A0ABN7K702_9BACT|nr:excalibur calcium-binding domain-containing protein [Campylobacter suis]CAD7288257.1 hypothetical protein LMG8286_01225 [Campylobacter suis]